MHRVPEGGDLSSNIYYNIYNYIYIIIVHMINDFMIIIIEKSKAMDLGAGLTLGTGGSRRLSEAPRAPQSACRRGSAPGYVLPVSKSVPGTL